MSGAGSGSREVGEGPLEATVLGPEATEPGEATLLLRVTNRSNEDVAVLDPGAGTPPAGMEWPASEAAYRASLLLSFGHLEVSVTDPAGRELRREPLETWVTPIPRPPIALAPGDSVDVPVPVGAFYRLEPGRRYGVTVAYGEGDAKVRARGGFTAP